MENPEPYRSPLGYSRPHLLVDGYIAQRDDVEVHISIPNEDPETEDDLTIGVHFTSEGIIIDLFVSDGEPVATFGQTYDEFVDTIYALDPMVKP